MRVAYHNEKYPWIQAVWKYTNPRNHWPAQWDIARLAFPTHIDAVGKHIVHWAWRGYRDCIDVDVLPDSTPVADTSAAIYGYKASAQAEWIRIDHAQVPKDGYTPWVSKSNCARNYPAYKFQTCFVIPPEGETIYHQRSSSQWWSPAPAGTEKYWTRDFALQRCKDKCSSNTGSCDGVQVVPLPTGPADGHLAFNGTEDRNIPWGRGDCVTDKGPNSRCLTPGTYPAGSLVCYPIKLSNKPTAEISERWDVSPDDPRDEVFYSTLYLRTERWAFDGPRLEEAMATGGGGGGGAAAEETAAAPWLFGDQCLSCDDAEAIRSGFDALTVASWEPADTCTLWARKSTPTLRRRRRAERRR